MTQLRARVFRARHLDFTFIPDGWLYEVYDLNRRPESQVIVAGVRRTQQRALDMACFLIKLWS